ATEAVETERAIDRPPLGDERIEEPQDSRDLGLARGPPARAADAGKESRDQRRRGRVEGRPVAVEVDARRIRATDRPATHAEVLVHERESVEVHDRHDDDFAIDPWPEDLPDQ